MCLYLSSWLPLPPSTSSLPLLIVLHCLLMPPRSYYPVWTCPLPHPPAAPLCPPSQPGLPIAVTDSSNTAPTSLRRSSVKVPNLRSAWLAAPPNFEYSRGELSRSSFQILYAHPSVDFSYRHLGSFQVWDFQESNVKVEKLPSPHRDQSATTKAADLFPIGQAKGSHFSSSGCRMKILGSWIRSSRIKV